MARDANASCYICRSKDKSGRTSVRPLCEIKCCDALNEAHVFDFDELAPFFFFFFDAITLLLLFDELDPAGIEVKSPSPDHRKIMAHYE
jgi:hypothetical protein